MIAVGDKYRSSINISVVVSKMMKIILKKIPQLSPYLEVCNTILVKCLVQQKEASLIQCVQISLNFHNHCSNHVRASFPNLGLSFIKQHSDTTLMKEKSSPDQPQLNTVWLILTSAAWP